SQGKTGTYPNCVASTTNNTTTNTTNKTTTTSPGTSNAPTSGMSIPNIQNGLYQSTPSSSGVSSSSYSGNSSPILVKVKSGGKPVSGATVNLSNQKQITNSSGIANFNALPGGYTLTIEGKGIKTKTINITVLPFDPGQQFTANVDSSGISVISAAIILAIIGLVGSGIYLAIKNKDKLSSLMSKTGSPKNNKNNKSHENATNNSNIIVPGTFNANPVSQIIKPGTPLTTNIDSAPKPIVGMTGSPNHPTMEPTIIRPDPILPTAAKPTNNQIIRK
ncbi:MAG: carboxypeptidase-like regulatory domain-containing protein, partial [bacterium]